MDSATAESIFIYHLPIIAYLVISNASLMGEALTYIQLAYKVKPA
jgi:hypothetical protein